MLSRYELSIKPQMERAKANAITKRNGVIDGWRGISVLLVILGHFVGYRMPWLYPVDALNRFGFSVGTRTFDIISSLGELGVSFFFGISGYLITSLLVVEEGKHDHVSLKAFYVRRVFRIMPAFYLYVAVVFAMQRLGFVPVDNMAVVRSSFYICNFSGFSCSWWLAHTWSLAVEEQFYLTWPILFVLAPSLRRKAALCLLVGIALGSFAIPEIRSFNYILIGVVVALWPAAQSRLARIGGPAIWGALGVLLLSPFTARIPFVREIIFILQPVLVAMVLFGTVLGPKSGKLQRAIQHPILVKIGLVSYSLYLWQQLSLAPVQWGGGATGAAQLYDGIGALLVVAFVPLAIASYRFLEGPFVAIGHRISRRIIERGSKRPEPGPVWTSGLP